VLSQVKSLDWETRQAQFVCRLPEATVAEIHGQSTNPLAVAAILRAIVAVVVVDRVPTDTVARRYLMWQDSLSERHGAITAKKTYQSHHLDAGATIHRPAVSGLPERGIFGVWTVADANGVVMRNGYASGPTGRREVRKTAVLLVF